MFNKPGLFPTLLGVFTVGLTTWVFGQGLMVFTKAYAPAYPLLVPVLYALGLALAYGTLVLYKKYKHSNNVTYWYSCVITAFAALNCGLCALLGSSLAG